MQRWILLSVLAAALVLGGGGFAAWQYRQGRPVPIWVPLPLNPEIPESQHAGMAETMRQDLTQSDVLNPIARDLGLAGKWDLPTDEAAAAELKQRVFVEIGEMISPIGARVPSVNVGIRGSRREQPLTEAIAKRLMEKVRKMVTAER